MKVARQKRQMWKKSKKFNEKIKVDAKMKCKRFEEKNFDVVNLWFDRTRVDCNIEERNINVLKSSFLKFLNLSELSEIFELFKFSLIKNVNATSLK